MKQSFDLKDLTAEETVDFLKIINHAFNQGGLGINEWVRVSRVMNELLNANTKFVQIKAEEQAKLDAAAREAEAAIKAAKDEEGLSVKKSLEEAAKN